jgi:hypothetical protein
MDPLRGIVTHIFTPPLNQMWLCFLCVYSCYGSGHWLSPRTHWQQGPSSAGKWTARCMNSSKARETKEKKSH